MASRRGGYLATHKKRTIPLKFRLQAGAELYRAFRQAQIDLQIDERLGLPPGPHLSEAEALEASRAAIGLPLTPEEVARRQAAIAASRATD